MSRGTSRAVTTGATTTLLSRRTLLGLLAGSAAGLLVGCSDDGSPEEARVCDAVGAGGEEVPEGLVVIGTRYRELHPDDDPSVIGADLPPDDPAAGLAALAQRVRADFAAGDTVDVDGWVLARTEARAAAVLSSC